MTCAHCGKPVTGRFQIDRYDASGALKMSVTVCSLLCLVQWAYTHGVMKGFQGAFAAKNAFQQLLDSIKGPKT